MIWVSTANLYSMESRQMLNYRSMVIAKSSSSSSSSSILIIVVVVVNVWKVMLIVVLFL